MIGFPNPECPIQYDANVKIYNYMRFNEGKYPNCILLDFESYRAIRRDPSTYATSRYCMSLKSDEHSHDLFFDTLNAMVGLNILVIPVKTRLCQVMFIEFNAIKEMQQVLLQSIEHAMRDVVEEFVRANIKSTPDYFSDAIRKICEVEHEIKKTRPYLEKITKLQTENERLKKQLKAKKK